MVTDPPFPVYDAWKVDMSSMKDECTEKQTWTLSYEDSGAHMHFEKPNSKEKEGLAYARCSG